MTLTRREIFGCWLPLVVPPALTDPPLTVLYDDRAAPLLLSAARLAPVRLRKMSDDLADVYNHLVNLQAAPAQSRRLVGVTDSRLLFAIEALAAHVGFRVVFHRRSSLTDWQVAVLDAMAKVHATAAPVRTLHLQWQTLLAAGVATLSSWVLLPREGSV